jgi:Double sensory domain of two-component sensor kinase
MASARLSAETKLVLTLLSIGALSGALGAELVSRGFEERAEAVGATVLTGANEAFQAQQAAEVDKLGATLDALLASRELRAAFVKRDREGLQRLAAPILEVLQERDHVTHWYFHEPGPDRRVFLRVHRPELFGDAVERITLRRAAETGEQGAGLELGRTAFALRVVRPWIVDEQLIGYMELAEEVTRFLATMKGRTGDEYGLLIQKRFIDEKSWAAVLGPRANTWNARPDVLVVDAADFTDGIAQFDGDVERLPETGRFLGEAERLGRTFIRGAFPITDAAGRRVAALFVVHDFTAHHAAVRGGRRQAFAILLLLALATTATTVVLVRRTISSRLTEQRDGLERKLAGRAPGA